MFPLGKPIPDGSPWIDYKEAEKTGRELRFIFRIENYLTFGLRELGLTYPCDINGRSQAVLKASANVSSSQNLFMPQDIPPELFSSPSQNFNQGALDEAATGMRLSPLRYYYPCDKGDTITVSIVGSPTGIVIGCWITGRKYGGELWL